MGLKIATVPTKGSSPDQLENKIYMKKVKTKEENNNYLIICVKELGKENEALKSKSKPKIK